MLSQSSPISSSENIQMLDVGEQNDHEQQTNERNNRCCLTKCFKWVAKHPIKAAVIAGAAVAITGGAAFAEFYLIPIITVALSNRTVTPSPPTVTHSNHTSPTQSQELLKVYYGYCSKTKAVADLKCCKLDDNQTRRWALTKKSDAAQFEDPCSNYGLKGGTAGCNINTKVRLSENGTISDQNSMYLYCLNDKKDGASGVSIIRNENGWVAYV